MCGLSRVGSSWAGFGLVGLGVAGLVGLWLGGVGEWVGSGCGRAAAITRARGSRRLASGRGAEGGTTVQRLESSLATLRWSAPS